MRNVHFRLLSAAQNVACLNSLLSEVEIGRNSAHIRLQWLTARLMTTMPCGLLVLRSSTLSHSDDEPNIMYLDEKVVSIEKFTSAA